MQTHPVVPPTPLSFRGSVATEESERIAVVPKMTLIGNMKI